MEQLAWLLIGAIATGLVMYFKIFSLHCTICEQKRQIDVQKRESARLKKELEEFQRTYPLANGWALLSVASKNSSDE